jgi:hypothetical protein
VLRALPTRFVHATALSLESAADRERVQRATLRETIKNHADRMCETMLGLASLDTSAMEVDVSRHVTPDADGRVCSDGEVRADRHTFGTWLLVATPDFECVARVWEQLSAHRKMPSFRVVPMSCFLHKPSECQISTT